MSSVKDKQLFRPSALEMQQAKWLSDIVLIRPISFSFLTAVAAILAVIVVIFLIWGTYAKRSTISGQLLPDSGLVKVYVPQPGIVLEKHVVEGQAVSRSDVLYVLSSDRQSSPPCQNSCRLDRTKNVGAMKEERIGTIRAGIQG